MADLSYDDAVQAAQSGTRDILDLLQKMQLEQQHMGGLQQRAAVQLGALQQQLIMCNRQLQSIAERIEQLTRQSVSLATVDHRIGPLQHDLTELRSRFAAVERFAVDVSNYLQGSTEIP